MRFIARALLLTISSAWGLSAISTPELRAQPTHSCQPAESNGASELAPLLSRALSGIDLDREQSRIIDTIEEQAEEAGVTLDRAREAVLLALADGLERGKVELAALTKELPAYIATRQEFTKTLRAILQGVHEALDPGQRSAFADAFEQQLKSRAGFSISKEWLESWSQPLHLSQEQKDEIRKILEAQQPLLSAEMTRLDRALTAFKGESFSLAEFVPFKLDPFFAIENALRMVHTTNKIAEILTPEQRTEAARMLRDRICEASSEPPAHSYDFPYSGSSGLIR